MLNLFAVLAGLFAIVVFALFAFTLPISRGPVASSGQRIAPPRVHIARGVIGATPGAVLLILGLSGPFVGVPAGNVGVVTNFGSVQTVTLEPGLHLVVPIYQRVTNVDTRV